MIIIKIIIIIITIKYPFSTQTSSEKICLTTQLTRKVVKTSFGRRHDVLMMLWLRQNDVVKKLLFTGYKDSVCLTSNI